jgi:dienelactone hydrolase
VSEVIMFHHVQGLTGGVGTFADRLRSEHHTVHVPDLFDGRTFATLEEGMAYAKSVGFGAIQARGIAAAEALPPNLVYIGVSMGVMAAQQLAQTRGGALGAVLIDACLPTEEFGSGWPDGVPVQIHGMDADPIFAGEGDLDAGRALVDAAEDAELFVYPGDKHLWSDASLPSHDPAATELMISRVLDFLAKR